MTARRTVLAGLSVSLALAAACAGPTEAAETRVAVAANFAEPAREIAARFEATKPFWS